VLSRAEVDQFVEHGLVAVRSAFSADVAAACRDILWDATGCDRNDRATWTQPVVRVFERHDPPFAEAANTPALRDAFDQLVGAGRWQPRFGIGTIPIRFPHADDAGDTGWHIDSSIAPASGDPMDFSQYRINVWSDGRALLMLFLFSEVGEDDAPTRIQIGSHLEMAPRLLPFGRDGATVWDLVPFPEDGDVALATGAPGDVYLCHPFLVHAAQSHRGTQPRFLGQPPLHATVPFELERADGAYSPVEQSIRLGLSMAPP
jgi:hypothetical protein